VTVKFLLSYSTRPLQMFGLLGGLMGATGAVILAYLGFLKISGHAALTQREPLVLLGILLAFTGLQLVTLGLLAELQSRTYHESQGKPVYVIRRILEHDVEPVEAASHLGRDSATVADTPDVPVRRGR
jgi:hypothetical protein